MNEIDDALSNQREIEPSPFFVSRVMSAVSEPPPLPFPWKRIASAMILLIVMIVAGVRGDSSQNDIVLHLPMLTAIAAMVASALIALLSFELMQPHRG